MYIYSVFNYQMTNCSNFTPLIEVALELEKQPVNFIQQQQQPLVSSNRFTEIQPQDLQGNSVNQFNMVFKESLPNSFISTEIVNSDHIVSRHNNGIHSSSNIDFTGNNVESSRPNPISSYVTMNSVANHSIHHHVENNITSLNNNNNCIKQEKTIFIGQNRLSKDKHSVLPSPSSSGGVGGSDHFGRITDNLAAVSLDNDNDDNDNSDDDDQNKQSASSNNHAVQRESNSEINPDHILLPTSSLGQIKFLPNSVISSCSPQNTSVHESSQNGFPNLIQCRTPFSSNCLTQTQYSPASLPDNGFLPFGEKLCYFIPMSNNSSYQPNSHITSSNITHNCGTSNLSQFSNNNSASIVSKIPNLSVGNSTKVVNDRSAIRTNRSIHRNVTSGCNTQTSSQQNGTTRSQDTDTPDESGVGESIISNESPAESRACGVGIMSSAVGVGVVATMNSITSSAPCQADWRLNVPFEVSMPIDDHSQHFHHAQVITPTSNVIIHHPHSYPYLFHTTNTSTTATTTINTTTTHISSASSSTQFSVNPLMEQFSTIPPHDRIGSYLKSLGELDTSCGRHHRCNEPLTFAYHQSQPNESNLPTDILDVDDKTFNHPSNFLHYPPPPPPPVPPPPHSSIMECCNPPSLPPMSTTNNASIQLSSHVTSTGEISKSNISRPISPVQRSKQYFHSKGNTDGESGTNMNQTTNRLSSNNQNISQLKASSEQNNISVDESSLNHNNSSNNNTDIKDMHSNTSYSKISQARRRNKVDVERAVSGNAGHLDYPGVGRRHLPVDDRSEEESNTEEVPRSLEDETLSIASDSPNNSLDNSISIKPDADLSGGGEGDDVYQAPDSYYLPNVNNNNNSNSQNLQLDSTAQESVTNLLERSIELVNWTKDLCSYCEMEYEIPNASFIELSNCLDSFRIELEAYIVEHISNNPNLTKTILISCDNLGKQTTNLSLHLKTMEIDKPTFSVHCNSCHLCLKEIHEYIVQLLNKSKVTNEVTTTAVTTGSTTSVTNQTHLHDDRSFSTTANTTITTTTHVFGKV
ncbi:unnamed protein product [Schistosoma spindalis]|nr:unnamed protein product [Schistosoma spindale]